LEARAVSDERDLASMMGVAIGAKDNGSVDSQTAPRWLLIR
jgi:hypothetical protein